MRKLHLIVFIILASLKLTAQEKYPKNEVLSDLEYLRSSLEETHYNLYAFCPKKEFEQNFNRVKASIEKDTLSQLEVISLFQKVISRAHTGHAEINFPAAAYRDFASKGGKVFPLEIAFAGKKVLIRKNFSDNPNLQPGIELLSIDGQSIAAILDKIYPQLSAETVYFKQAKLELWSFPRLYWQVFASRASFKVRVKINGAPRDFDLPAVDLINGYESKRTEIITGKRQLKFYGPTAYLKPGNFGGDLSEFKAFIDSVFVEIQAHQSKHLLVDLRNNQGGDDVFSNYMVSYFADRPFQWTSHFSLKSSQLLKAQTRLHNDTTKAYFQEILARPDGELYNYSFAPYSPQEESKRYKGKVQVLINRQSYSMAAVTAALIQDYHFATLIGEETGDHPSLHASQFNYPLPHTGIIVNVPKGYMIRPNGEESGRGVIPDIMVKDHLLDEKDEILEAALKLLE